MVGNNVVKSSKGNARVLKRNEQRRKGARNHMIYANIRFVWLLQCFSILSHSDRCGSSEGTIRASKPSAFIEVRTPASRRSLSMGSSALLLLVLAVGLLSLLLLSLLLLLYLAVSLARACST